MPELDLGNVKGPQGKSAYQSALDAGYSGSEEAFNTAMAKAPDAVLYTAQSLTNEQQAQARGNLNAAPGGFGLGDAAKMLTKADNVDRIRESGWYTWHWDPTRQPAGLPDEAKYHTGLMRVDSANPNTYDNVQTIYIILSPPNSNPGDQCVVQRMGLNAPNVWNPWEWVNPPMELGTEYRTTERHFGKPVYVKVLEFSAITDGEQIDIGVSQILRANVYEVYGTQYIPVPQVPLLMHSTNLPNANGLAYFMNVQRIAFVRGVNNGSTKIVVTIYYTK